MYNVLRPAHLYIRREESQSMTLAVQQFTSVHLSQKSRVQQNEIGREVEFGQSTLIAFLYC